MNQVINAAAKMKSMSGGQYGCAYYCFSLDHNIGRYAQFLAAPQAFESWYTGPRFKVIVPSNPKDAKGLLKSCNT